MSNDAHPIQSYGIDRDSYVIRYGASKNARDAEITTTIGVVVDRDVSKKLKEPEFHGKKYRYYILSHSKMLAKPEFISQELEDEKTEEQRAEEELKGDIEWEEIINRSLLYVTESDDLFEKYDRVFVEKNGSNIEIKGYPSYGRKAAFRDNQFIIAAESCKIQVTTVKVLVDENDNEVEPGAPQASASATNGAVSNKEQEEKKQYKYKYKITSQANCAEDIEEFQELLDDYIESAQDRQPVEFFDGYEKASTGPIPKKIPGKKYAKGRSYWGGTMYANYDIIIPLSMEKDLKELCEKYHYSRKLPLHINSVFRSHEHQMKLYELWNKKKKLMKDTSIPLDQKRALFHDSEGIAYDKVNKAAKPPTSGHNFGYAIDFQLTTDPSDEKYYKKSNADFEEIDYLRAISRNINGNGNLKLDASNKDGKRYSMRRALEHWPKVFQWLMAFAPNHGFTHPPGVDGSQGLFEGWHWVYKRKK